ncbi:hypothetical protein [Vibrio coralliilyticus]|uniref:hypothetical protein n=1 Tax=Vibrio coralliilyticus TaxID=190893 RepID=UPI001E2B5C09|nr:hypothetical protein [Vibrio coralliilyticus]MCC2524931.1 hypothetical protein [Vibrio coralliilyticus]
MTSSDNSKPEDLSNMSEEELKKEKKTAEEELKQEQERQHELMKEYQGLVDKRQRVDMEAILDVKQAPEPVQNQNKSQPNQEKTVNSSVAAVALSRYLKRKKPSAKPNVASVESNNQQIEKALSTPQKGSQLDQLIESTKSHITTLKSSTASDSDIMQAMTAIGKNVKHIDQAIEAQFKGLAFKDKKEFDKGHKALERQLKKVAGLGKSIASDAVNLEIRNAMMPDGKKLNFHAVGEQLQGVADSFRSGLKQLIDKLSPSSIGMKVGA